MSRFIETISCVDGVIARLPYHQRRMDKTFAEALRAESPHQLEELISRAPCPTKGVYKCRVVYDQHDATVSFEKYTPKPIQRLKLIHADHIDYTYKSEERAELERMHGQRGLCDDVLMLKHGFVTDASYANIAFLRKGQWVTPDTCLLKGTMRQYLLDHQMLVEESIREADIQRYECFKLINAMLGWEFPPLDVSNIN